MSAQSGLSFVVQKHWASHLHYDFRLEWGGTLKSWAVPKGPSFDPKDKRMAVQVEDHPLAYASFEGTIAAKQYGAGKVIIWDQGTWHPQGNASQGLQEGNLKFELRGHKLQGAWVLVRMKSKNEKQPAWLLIKEKDAFARPAAQFSVVDELPDSVKPSTAPAAKASAIAKQAPVSPEGKPAKLPLRLVPQLATLATRMPSDPEHWLFEIKFDGYRLLTRIKGSDVQLFTRNGNDWTTKLLPLQHAVAQLKLPDGWYDGEIVMPNAQGVPDFGALQQAFDNANTSNIILYLFDLPYFNGHDLRGMPLEARRAVLQNLLEQTPCAQVRMSAAFDESPQSIFKSACQLGLEGVIAKRRGATYQPGRSPDWIKLKCGQRQEFVVGGYTEPRGARPGLGALLLGVHDAQGQLHYAGKVGAGFALSDLMRLKVQLSELENRKNPFLKTAAIAETALWVKPTLVAEVSFSEWTRNGHIRHAVFRGIRSDKAAHTIVRETGTALMAASDTNTKEATRPTPSLAQITHPERVIDASATGITKIELARYYALVGELMMPHLKGRPVSLVRAPGGIQGEQFFQKHAPAQALAGIRLLDAALDPGHLPLLAVAGQAGLLSAVQWNVVEFHTQNATALSYAHPDRMVFDLDPGAGVAWKQVQLAAQLVRAFLLSLGLPCYLKTSGGKGLHLVVPLRKLHDWATVKSVSKAITRHLAATLPRHFVAISGPQNRIGKIFIDYLRNGQGSTTVCAWSARARPGMGISVPVAWDELASLRGGDHWRVQTAHTRLDKGNDPWRGYGKAAPSLSAAIRLLDWRADKA